MAEGQYGVIEAHTNEYVLRNDKGLVRLSDGDGWYFEPGETGPRFTVTILPPGTVMEIVVGDRGND